LSTFDLVSDARVTLLHVLPTSAASGLRRAIASKGEPAEESRRKRRADADAMLAEGAAMFSDPRYPVERLVSEGDPAREIVRSAHTRDVDLVVVGARGLGTLGRFLLGSVSEAVLHHMDRPVAIIRARD
jgi:nucleotide-binding universal stress UspA family protein